VIEGPVKLIVAKVVLGDTYLNYIIGCTVATR